jgi:protease YdgD
MRALVALAALLGLAPIWVPGFAAAQDLRPLVLRQDLLGWEGVGRVAMARGGFCTGVLIAPDTVLTAAHCLYAEGRLRAREEITFRAGDRNGEAIAARRVVQAAVPDAWAGGAGSAAERVAADVALLRLEAAIPAAIARPFRVGPAVSGGSVSVVSYGAGREAVLSRQARCTVLGRAQAFVAFDCDVTFGSSGAPVFRIDGAQTRIVSIVVSGDRTEDGVTAFGPVLDGMVDDLMDRLRRGEGVWEATAPAARRLAPGAARGAGGARFVAP